MLFYDISERQDITLSLEKQKVTSNAWNLLSPTGHKQLKLVAHEYNNFDLLKCLQSITIITLYFV